LNGNDVRARLWGRHPSYNSVLPTLCRDACGWDASAIRGTLYKIAREETTHPCADFHKGFTLDPLNMNRIAVEGGKKMIITYIVAGLMFVLSLILLSGRGSLLIAGYNTMSKEQQNKYDSKKLTRATGTMSIITSFALLALAFSLLNAIVFLIIVFISVTITIIYTNKYCLKADYDNEETDLIIDKGKGSLLNNKTMIGIGFAIIVFLLVGVSMYFSSKPPVYAISNGTLIISTQFGEKVNLSEIQSVQLKDDLPAIESKINGLGLGPIKKGKFSSDIGNVTLYIDSSKPPFIYIKTTSELVILNDQSKSKTDTLFNELNLDIKKWNFKTNN